MTKIKQRLGNLRNGVFVSFDSVTRDRLKRYAAINHGTTEGYEQDYIRAAVIKQLNTDELAESKTEGATPA
jgi:hypothetical protein